MSRSIVLAVLVIVLAAPAAAQCAYITGMSFTEYGAGCSAFFQDPPWLNGAFDQFACTLTLNMPGWPGNCPAACLNSRILAIGLVPTMVPLPIVPCDLLVVPDIILSFPAVAGDSFTFNLFPAPLAGINLYVQAAQEFLTPSGTQFEVSNGLTISIF